MPQLEYMWTKRNTKVMCIQLINSKHSVNAISNSLLFISHTHKLLINSLDTPLIIDEAAATDTEILSSL